MNRRSLVYIIISISLFFVFVYSVKTVVQKDFEIIMNQNLQSTKIAYNSIFDTYKVAALKDYESLVSNKEVVSVLKEFKYANENRQNILRGKLYRLLVSKYENLKELGVRQFHFHTHKGDSLLRFHNPYNSADSLINFRTSIKQANKKFQRTFGFEGGRALPGFRYVFPIIVNKEHLGSVEFSLAFEAIEEKLKAVLPSHAYVLLMNKETTLNKVFDSYKKYFENSSLSSDYFIENEKISRISSFIKHDKLIHGLDKLIKDSPSFKELHKQNSDFSLSIFKDDSSYVINFLALKNINDGFAGYIVSYSQFDQLNQIKDKYNLFMIIGIILIMVLVYLLTALLKQRTDTLNQKDKLEQSNRNLQTIIDKQKNIIIIFKDKNIVQVNQKFLSLLGFETLESFSHVNSCISNFLLLDDSESILGKKEFLEYQKSNSLIKLDNKTVKIFNKDTNKEEYFLINSDSYSNRGHILVLTNISELLNLQRIVSMQSKIAAVGEMIANIAHQWRQPLSIITTSVSGLRIQAEINEIIEKKLILECIHNVSSQAQYLSSTIDDFRNFFKEDSNKIDEYNVKDAVLKSLDLTKDILNSNYIEVVLDLENIKLLYNQNILIQSLMNIINNTKDAMLINKIDDQSRFLFIDLSKNQDELILCVKDSAGGIDEKIIDKIFEPYFTTKHQSIGTGIGLYMTYQIITKQLKGKVFVQNVDIEYKDKKLRGAEFKICIPLV